ncbi:MAG: hypothetical protein ACOVVK_16675 [Elsteraceae bacterium]
MNLLENQLFRAIWRRNLQRRDGAAFAIGESEAVAAEPCLGRQAAWRTPAPPGTPEQDRHAWKSISFRPFAIGVKSMAR